MAVSALLKLILAIALLVFAVQILIIPLKRYRSGMADGATAFKEVVQMVLILLLLAMGLNWLLPLA